MTSLQKKVLITLTTVFFALLALWLPHKPLAPTPPPLTEVLGERANNAGLGELIIEPEDGDQPIVAKIDTAQQSIDMTIYLLSDPEVIDSLITAHNRGVAVRVLMEKAPFGGGNVNKTSREKLTAAGIPVQDAPALIALAHQKSFIIDHQELVITTFNYTKAAFSNNRGFAISDRSPPDVAEAVKIFDADWTKTLYSPSVPNLVVSPDNSRSKLESLINSAKQEIKIAAEVLEDREIISLLNKKSREVSVQVLLANPDKIAQNLTASQDLKEGKSEVKFLNSPYLHAKLIIVDDTYAYIGSVNLTRQSLEQNRELGIIFSNPDLVSKLGTVFAEDWSAGYTE